MAGSPQKPKNQPIVAEANGDVGNISMSGAGLHRDAYRRFIENLPVMFYAVGPEAPHTPIYISPEFEKFGLSTLPIRR